MTKYHSFFKIYTIVKILLCKIEKYLYHGAYKFCFGIFSLVIYSLKE